MINKRQGQFGVISDFSSVLHSHIYRIVYYGYSSCPSCFEGEDITGMQRSLPYVPQNPIDSCFQVENENLAETMCHLEELEARLANDYGMSGDIDSVEVFSETKPGNLLKKTPVLWQP